MYPHKIRKKDLLFQRNFLGILQELNYGDVEGPSIAMSQGSTGQSLPGHYPPGQSLPGKFPPRNLPAQTLPNQSVLLAMD